MEAVPLCPLAFLGRGSGVCTDSHWEMEAEVGSSPGQTGANRR